MGLERLKEALEANDWESNELGQGVDIDDFDVGEEEGEAISGFGIEAAEMEMEMFGMKQAIYGGINVEENGDEEDQDNEVEQLQAMMLRVQAVRGKCFSSVQWKKLIVGDMGEDMPEAERKRFAAKAVNDIMKKL